MLSLSSDPSKDNPTRQELQAAAETRMSGLSRLADDLLQELDGADVMTAEALRSEATRLFGLCHEITEALVRDEIAVAYRISAGDDVNGTSLGVAV